MQDAHTPLIFVGGSRIYSNYPTFRTQLLEFLLRNYPDQEPALISGGAQGVDSLAEHFAKEFNLPITVVEADWEKEGKSAGVKRTIRIFEEYKPNMAFLVWDGASKGTGHTVDIARKYNVPTAIYYFFNPALKPTSYAKLFRIPVLRTNGKSSSDRGVISPGKSYLQRYPNKRRNRVGKTP